MSRFLDRIVLGGGQVPPTTPTPSPSVPSLTNTRANSTLVYANSAAIAAALIAVEQQIAAKGG